MLHLINHLNDLLHNKCSKLLELEIGPYDDFKTRKNVSLYPDEHSKIVLCLNLLKKKKQCISSISCKINDEDQSIEILSKTHEKHEGKKYNLLLRSAIILLAKYTETQDGKPVTKIVSRAINPISAFSMIKYFNAQNDSLNTYMEENHIEPVNITLDNVRAYFDENGNIDANQELTEEEESALMKKNPEFGNIIDLIVDLKNDKTIEKTMKTYHETIERILCPVGITRKRKRKRNSRTYSSSRSRSRSTLSK